MPVHISKYLVLVLLHDLHDDGAGAHIHDAVIGRDGLEELEVGLELLTVGGATELEHVLLEVQLWTCGEMEGKVKGALGRRGTVLARLVVHR